MILQDPAVAARLLLGLSAHMAERLRDTNRQLKLYARLATAMREELANVSTPTAASTQLPERGSKKAGQ
jgi:hypothetical protein